MARARKLGGGVSEVLGMIERGWGKGVSGWGEMRDEGFLAGNTSV